MNTLEYSHFYLIKIYQNFSLSRTLRMPQVAHQKIANRILNYHCFRSTMPQNCSISQHDEKVTVFCFWITIPRCLPIMTECCPYRSRLLFLSFLFISTDADYPSMLQEVEVPIIKRQKCENIYNPLGSFLPQIQPVIEETMICAGDLNKGKDTCQVRVCS